MKHLSTHWEEGAGRQGVWMSPRSAIITPSIIIDRYNNQGASRSSGGKEAEPHEQISVMALTSLLQKEEGVRAFFSCFADRGNGERSTTHCISNCSGIWGTGHISYCYKGWSWGGKVFFMLVTAALSLGWLGFCQVHALASPTVGSCSLGLTLWQSFRNSHKYLIHIHRRLGRCLHEK